MHCNHKFLIVKLLSAVCLAVGGGAAASAEEQVPSWQNAEVDNKDTPLHDPMLLYNAGGLNGKVAVIGLPSMKTYRHISVGVDLHEVVYGGSPAGNKNGTPDGKYLYVNDKGANTIGEINLQTGMLERLIALPFPFGLHHIALSTDGKYLFGTGEYTGKMSKTEISTGKTQIIDWGPAPSAPDYLDVGKKGKYVFAGNYYHSTVGVFSANPFKFIKAIPVGKNPHGVDVIPEGTVALVSDKLSATMTVIDIETLAVKKVLPTCAGPLHTVMDVYDKDGGTYEPGKDSPEGLTSKYAYQSCFVADSNVKIDLKTLEVVDEIPTHYRTGHIAISADNKYVIALNKFSTGLFSPTGVVYPVNFEMWDAREDSPTYGKTLKLIPVDGEPHNAKTIYAYQIKDWTMGQAEKGGLLKAGLTPAIYPHNKAKAKRYFMPKSNEQPGIRVVDGVKEIHIKAFSYGYIPRQIRVNKGDKVRLFVTNIDKAAGITKNPDVTMGFTIYGPYGLRTNLAAPRGVTAVTEFVADIAGEYAIFCQHFCGPLHLEMRGSFFVDDPNKEASSLAVGDYEEAQRLPGLVQEGELTIAERVKSL
ncbi:MAG: beta-propeller fold lactonase family protein [Gammaproteobacteria bacterium]|nr:beta-propeller fold lactonase family protein [Gammaproteobacteria bacterium]